MCPIPKLCRLFLTPLSARALLIIVLIMGGLASTPASAEVSYDLGLYSAYVWRGISFTDGAVFQPSVTTSHESGFSFNVWGNLDIDDGNDLSGDFQEIDLTLSYAFGKGPVTYEVGLIEYLFPNGGGPGTREAYFAVGLDTTVAPTVTLYYDFDEVDDIYASLGVEYSRELSNQWSTTIGLLAGYAGADFAADYGGTDSGLFNGDLTVAITYTEKRCKMTLLAAYTESLDQDVLPEQPVDVWGGVSFGCTF